MKIHTVRKYLAQLTTDPITNLAAHYKILNDAVCKNLGVRPVNNITLAVVGQDDEYTASVVSAALKHASISSATVNFDVTLSPETAITINGEQLPSEVISRIITVIRTVERSLASKLPDEFVHPSIYEVFLLGALCACSEMGVTNIILQLDLTSIPATIASIIPQPKMICCNEIFPEEADFVRAIARKSVECIVSAPQQRESRRALYNLCNELNCNHAVVARGEIETETPTFRGYPFKYRGFEAVAGTQLVSLVTLSATALLVIRELAKFRVKLTDEDAYAAINYRRIPGRGEMISVRPYTLLCSFEHADFQSLEYVLSDTMNLVSERNRRVNIIADSRILTSCDYVKSMIEIPELLEKLNKIVVVGEYDNSNDKVECVPNFSAALAKFPYLKDIKHEDDAILFVCGSKDFLDKNRTELEETVRDNFTY